MPESAGPQGDLMNATVSPATESAKRKVGFMLGLGIFFLPIVFAWFLLRDGHTKRARIIGFVWLALACLVAINRSNEAPQTESTTSNTTSAETDSAKPQQSTLEQIFGDFPACDSDQAAETIIAAMEDAPLGRVYGLSIIKIRGANQVSSTATEMKCAGTAVLNNGEEKSIAYRFYKDGEDIMAEAEVMGLDEVE